MKSPTFSARFMDGWKRASSCPPPIVEDDYDSEETGDDVDEQPVPAVSKIQQLKLFVFKCPDCLKAFVVRKPGDLGTPPNTDIRCNCGTSTRIHSVHKASGECPNCGERFWDMHMLNGLSEIICRKCQSPIDLFEQKDGTMGTKS